MANRLLKSVVGFWLLLLGQTALAGPCPDGSFNPQQQVCMCPNGGYVGPGESCSGGGKVEKIPVPKTWGAIAIDMSSSQKGWGFASSEISQADANKKALGFCVRSSCRVALTFINTCGAITANGKGVWGGGIDLNKDKALQKAADACYAKGAKDCYQWVKPSCAAAPR